MEVQQAQFHRDATPGADHEVRALMEAVAMAALSVLAWNSPLGTVALAFFAAVMSFIIMNFIQATSQDPEPSVHQHHANEIHSGARTTDRVIPAAGGILVFKTINGKLTSRFFRE